MIVPRIEEQFADRFKNRNIRLSHDGIESRTRGKINKEGWSIWYLFGSDEQGEYLDYYSTHRMTTDSHTRIPEDGSAESLPVLEEMFIGSNSPAEHARLKAKLVEEIRKIAQLLETKGFGLSGDEPLSNQIRRVQMTGEAGRGDSRQGGT